MEKIRKTINHHLGHRALNSRSWMTQALHIWAYMKTTSTLFGIWVQPMDTHTPCPDAWVLGFFTSQMGGGSPRYLENWKSTCGAQMNRLGCHPTGRRFRLLSGLVKQREPELTVWVGHGCDTDSTLELVLISQCAFGFLTIILGYHGVRGLFLPRHRQNWPRPSELEGFIPLQTFLILTQMLHQGKVCSNLPNSVWLGSFSYIIYLSTAVIFSWSSFFLFVWTLVFRYLNCKPHFDC